MNGEVPDHSAQPWSALTDRAGRVLALDVDKADDLAFGFGDELDRVVPVVLLRLAHVPVMSARELAARR